MKDATADRYHRQMLLPQIGIEGQSRLARSRVLLVGCGALGTVLAEQLVRAGVGHLRIVDRDVVEASNLQRQVLFDESDARDGLPKAVAAARRLKAINSSIEVEALVADAHAGNVESFACGETNGPRVDVILDGADNVETRYLLNDVAVKHGIPWVYGACVGTEGRVLAIRPGETACLRCIFPEPPAGSELPTCDTAGVLGPAAATVASLQAVAALQLLTGHWNAAAQALITLDVWTGRFHRTPAADARRADCPTCGQRRFDFLEQSASDNTTLCGRNAVQIRPKISTERLDLARLAERLSPFGQVQRSDYLLRCQFRDPDEVSLTVFPDARAIVFGTNNPARARSIYAKYVGS